jgi:hypothetical protein
MKAARIEFHRGLLGLIICVCFVTHCSDNSSSSRLTSSPPTRGHHISSTLYVAPNGSGSGTKQDPLGSIQLALDSALVDSSITDLRLATGEYFEHLTIRSAITITGGLDRSADWSASDSQTTTIYPNALLSPAIAVAVFGVAGTVTLRHLYILGTEAVDLSANCYGIYCFGTTSVQIDGCQVFAGAGGDGKSGAPGEPGIEGDPGIYRTAGRSPVPGGMGGFGAISYDTGATAGEAGFCSDGSKSGGDGGTSHENGYLGSFGTSGIDGAGADDQFHIELLSDSALIMASSGLTGTAGSSGCGGGGGGGGPLGRSHQGYPERGGNGGGGGAGGGGGYGGHGGWPGGTSIGLCVIRGSVRISNSIIKAGRGGLGGAGGAAGPGGNGGKGAPGDAFGSSGFKGGDGGSGGDGGEGGGGSGGWSIGLLTIALDRTPTLFGSTITGSNPGWGGMARNPGPIGKAVSILNR